MSLADGSYHYYVAEKSTRPILCELMANYVCECGNEDWTPLSLYPGRFIRLVEEPQAEPGEAVDTPIAKG